VALADDCASSTSHPVAMVIGQLATAYNWDSIAYLSLQQGVVHYMKVTARAAWVPTTH